MEALAHLLAAIMWPLVVVFAILYFSQAIKERIGKVTEVDLTNRVLRFGEAKGDSQQGDLKMEATTVASPSASDAPRWDNTGNLYWLAYDLTWTAQVMLRAAPKQKILRGLKQVQYHMSHLVMGDFLTKFNALLKEAENVPEHAMTAPWRNDFSARVSRLSYEIGNLAGRHQPDFEKDVRKA
jgi:hypothetical protein